MFTTKLVVMTTYKYNEISNNATYLYIIDEISTN